METIHEVAEDEGVKVRCPFRKDFDLSGLDKWGRLKSYIGYDRCRKISHKKNVMKAMSSICSMVGAVPSQKPCFKIKKEEASEDVEGNWENDPDAQDDAQDEFWFL